LTILGCSMSVLAQNDYQGQGIISRFFNGDGYLVPSADGKGRETEEGVKPNAIKINLTALSANNIAIQYERALSNKFSFAIQGRYTLDINPQESITSTLNDFLQTSDSTKVGSPKLGGYAITPEFRWYPKHTMKGFYLGPYFRYRTNTVSLPFEFYNSSNTLVKNDLKGDISSIIFGLGMGIHGKIGQRISLDFYIGGVQFGSSVGKLKYEADNPVFTSADVVKIIDGIEEFKTEFIVPLGIEYDVTTSKVEVETRFSAPGIRFGFLSLGYRF
jgi:hypothetical protein